MTDHETRSGPSERAVRETVRDRYGAIASGPFDDDQHTGSDTDSGCCGSTDGCGEDRSRELVLGYSPSDLADVPAESHLGLGCGNPHAIADLSVGETVLDLGSGAGFDCFLAARAVGPSGSVIGVDMTPEMVERARTNASRHGFPTVTFRLGEIEHLPVADDQVDVVMSNCVVNLSPDKERVFQEAFRVLAPGGRVVISDVVRAGGRDGALDETDLDSIASCASGAATKPRLETILDDVGFVDVSIRASDESDDVIEEMYGSDDRADALYSAIIEARTPVENAPESTATR